MTYNRRSVIERIKQYFFTPISLLEYKKHYYLVVKFHCFIQDKESQALFQHLFTELH